MSDLQIKYEKPSPQKTQTRYSLKPFLKRGITFLTGRERAGKTSLCVKLAESIIQCEPLWESGPVPRQSRPVVFVISGPDDYFVPSHIRAKMPDALVRDKVIFAHNEKDYGELAGKSQFPFSPEHFIKIIKTHKPALVFFDLFKHRHRINPEFQRELLKCNTALIGLFNGLTHDYRVKIEPAIGRDISKSIPHLQVKVRNNRRVLTKYSGFADSPKDTLTFNLESNGQAFVAKDLRYEGPVSPVSSLDRLKGFMAKQFKDKSKSIALKVLKAEARKAGVSTYVLNHIKWQDIGFKAEGKGYGPEYKKYVSPADLH